MADDQQSSAELERTRGMTFCLAAFDESRFNASHAHCLADSRAISLFPGDESEGYVTFRNLVGPDGRSGWQYFWVCKECYGRLHSSLSWSVATDLPPTPPSSSNWSRRPEAGTLADLVELATEFPYALVGWAAEEIKGIGHSQGLEISLGEAEEFLRNNERRIECAMTSAGHAMILKLLAGAGFPARKL